MPTIGGNQPTVNLTIPVPTPVQTAPAKPKAQPVPQGGTAPSLPPAPAGMGQPVRPQRPLPQPIGFIFPWQPQPRQMRRLPHRVLRYARLTIQPGEPLMGGSDFMHEIHDESGTRVGHVWLSPMEGGNRIHINHIGAMGHEPNSLGLSAVRDLHRQLKALYPQAQKITGTRISGATQANTGENRAAQRPMKRGNQPQRYAKIPQSEEGVLNKEQFAIARRFFDTGDKTAWGVLGDHLADNGFPNAGAVLSRYGTDDPAASISDFRDPVAQQKPNGWFRYVVIRDGPNLVHHLRMKLGGELMAFLHRVKPNQQMRRSLKPRRYSLDLNETIRQNIKASRRQQRGNGYVQDTTAGGVLADALDDAGEPHAPFFRSLSPGSNSVFVHTDQSGRQYRQPIVAKHPVSANVNEGNVRWSIRPSTDPAAVVAHRVTGLPRGEFPSHTAVMRAPALREWAAHPKVTPSLRAALLNAATHLEAQEAAAAPKPGPDSVDQNQTKLRRKSTRLK